MDFRGTYTALITPFRPDGLLDEEGLRTNVERQIEAGIDGLVPCGTTGESPTLTPDEHVKVVEIVVDEADGRVPVLAGTGSNATAEAEYFTRHAFDAGADGALLISPYYNKPTQEGLYQHYVKIAQSVDFPLVLYTVPGRTNVNILPETSRRLAAGFSNIVGIKDATGDMDQIRQEIAIEGFTVMSGDDALTLPIIEAGGKGVVSVASNIVPARVSEMVSLALDGKIDKALAIHEELLPLFKVLFIETSPAPVKYAMNALGMPAGPLRLPLVEPARESKAAVDGVLRGQGLL